MGGTWSWFHIEMSDWSVVSAHQSDVIITLSLVSGILRGYYITMVIDFSFLTIVSLTLSSPYKSDITVL